MILEVTRVHIMAKIFRNLTTKLQNNSYRFPNYCTLITQPRSQPILSTQKYPYPETYQKPRQVWIENLDTTKENKLGLIELHPEVFGAKPRIDIIHQNSKWQQLYGYVSYNHAYSKAELRGGGRKPWPQKGTGRARHGSIRSPLWKGGGVAHGPKPPTTYFYMLPFFTRVAGLTSMLSVKLAQDDLHIVEDLEIPSKESSYVEQLIKERNWSPSVLFVDTEDLMPENISVATDGIKHMNLMPVYGLNVYSMLKHETLVLTTRAARLLEEKLLFHMHRSDIHKLVKKFSMHQP